MITIKITVREDAAGLIHTSMDCLAAPDTYTKLEAEVGTRLGQAVRDEQAKITEECGAFGPAAMVEAYKGHAAHHIRR